MAIGKKDNGNHWAVRSQNESSWQPIYIPSIDGVEIQHENVVGPDSGRTEDGYMHIDWRRRDVRKVSMTFKFLTGNEVNEMVSLMQGKEFDFRFMDHGVVQEISGYCGKCTYKYKTLALHSDEGGLYEDFKINVEEM